MLGLPLRMLLSLAVGLGGGMLAAAHAASALPALLSVVRPVGSLWLDALTMTIVPLVFGLIVNGIAAAAREAQASRTAVRAMICFAVLLVLACLLAAGVTAATLHYWPVSEQAGAWRDSVAPAISPASGAAWYDGIIPANPIKAAAETAMVPLVLFALLFGFALTRIEARLRTTVLLFTEGLAQAMLVLVRWVLWLAPLGITALAFVAGTSLGAAAAGTLGQYIVIASLAGLSATVLAYAAAIVAGRMSPLAFARAAAPAQAVALGSQSSLAALPVMIEGARAMNISASSAGIILPLAVSLFRAASAAANVSVAIYLAHLHGIALTLPMLAIAALVAVPVSLAAVGVAAQVSFMATIAPICIALGIPIVALPLLMAVETIPDLFRTVGNVTADLAVARLAGTVEGPPSR